jgi:hypothetical protein
VNEWLIDRGYVTWFDLTNMKGEYAVNSLSLSLYAPECARACVYKRRKYNGRDERCDRGGRRDAVRRELAIQGVGERAQGNWDCSLYGVCPQLQSLLLTSCVLPRVFLSLHCASQCRLEANYAYQQELDMVPLMVQQDYRPQGWCKLQYYHQDLR